MLVVLGVSDVYMLESVGDGRLPCETPFLNWRCVDVLFLNMEYALRSLVSVMCECVYVDGVECFAHI